MTQAGRAINQKERLLAKWFFSNEQLFTKLFFNDVTKYTSPTSVSFCPFCRIILLLILINVLE